MGPVREWGLAGEAGSTHACLETWHGEGFASLHSAAYALPLHCCRASNSSSFATQLLRSLLNLLCLLPCCRGLQSRATPPTSHPSCTTCCCETSSQAQPSTTQSVSDNGANLSCLAVAGPQTRSCRLEEVHTAARLQCHPAWGLSYAILHYPGDEDNGWSEEFSFKVPGGYPVRCQGVSGMQWCNWGC